MHVELHVQLNAKRLINLKSYKAIQMDPIAKCNKARDERHRLENARVDSRECEYASEYGALHVKF